MPKNDSGLPGDIAARMDEVLNRVVDELRAKLRLELHRMFRFANMDEVQAARHVLEDHGGPMSLNEIVEELKAGGIWRTATGSVGSSADSEIKRSVGRAAAHGVNIRYIDREKDLIGLPEAS